MINIKILKEHNIKSKEMPIDLFIYAWYMIDGKIQKYTVQTRCIMNRTRDCTISGDSNFWFRSHKVLTSHKKDFKDYKDFSSYKKAITLTIKAQNKNKKIKCIAMTKDDYYDGLYII